GIFRLLAMAGRDNEAVFIIGDGQVAVHLLDLLDRESGLSENAPSITLAELPLAEIDAHRQHPLERRDDRLFRTRGQKIGEIANRDPQRADVRNLTDGL